MKQEPKSWCGNQYRMPDGGYLNCQLLHRHEGQHDYNPALKPKAPPSDLEQALGLLKLLISDGPPVNVDENECYYCRIYGGEDDGIEELPESKHRESCEWRRARELVRRLSQ